MLRQMLRRSARQRISCGLSADDTIAGAYIFMKN